MKKLLIITFLLSSSLSYAYEKTFSVLERKTGKISTRILKKELRDLVSKHSFEGRLFKIVKGKNKLAINFNDADSQLLLKAATVYYHLANANDFWVNEINSPFLKKQKQLTIRIDIDSAYSKVGHYGNENIKKEYNNALTIPAGETPNLITVKDTWNDEIWFRPKKVIATKELPSISGDNPVTSSLRDLERPVINFAERNYKGIVL